MTTNEERRIVAARLRELAKDCASVSDFDLASILELEAYGQRSYCVESVTKLADLIEPEEGDNDAEMLRDVADGLFCDLMDADPLTAMVWAKAWPELFVKAVDDAN